MTNEEMKPNWMYYRDGSLKTWKIVILDIMKIENVLLEVIGRFEIKFNGIGRWK